MEELFDPSLGGNYIPSPYTPPSYFNPYEIVSNTFQHASSYHGLDHSFNPSYDYYPPPPFYDEPIPPPSRYSLRFEEKVLVLLDVHISQTALINSHSQTLAKLEAQVEQITSTLSRQEEEEEANEKMARTSMYIDEDDESEEDETSELMPITLSCIEEEVASELVANPIKHNMINEDFPCFDYDFIYDMATLESEKMLTTLEVGEKEEELVEEGLPSIISNDPLEEYLFEMYKNCGFDFESSKNEVNSLMDSFANLEGEEMVIFAEEKKDEEKVFLDIPNESLKDIDLPIHIGSDSLNTLQEHKNDARLTMIDFVFKTVDEMNNIISFISFQVILLEDDFIVVSGTLNEKSEKRINKDVSYPVFYSFD
ncbi:uncharacterized protein LOC132302843 [Cornus florida]|uniref:uncharacterized protein LOC132302843 n=1 Tax=Cornus florida TaxID=4283 RepID=UPI0028A0ACEE|nr:uncharacterized protein LOC132302843 [Cornus florida]XP_059655810.1 uncharacterized protein LOC132302843 [Cornus florida]